MLRDQVRLSALAARSAARALARRAVTRKRTRPTWTPKVEAVSAALRAVAAEAHGRPAPEVRAIWEMMARDAPLASRTRQEPARVDGLVGRWFYPDAQPAADDPVILYLHGGAYQFGSIRTHRELIAQIAQAAGRATLAIDYRLAPEHPWPAALEDATRAVRWLRARGVARLCVAGDSAGGNLALVTTLGLRDAGEALPERLALLCPWVDMLRERDSIVRNRDADWLAEDANLRWSTAYRAGADARDPRVSPIYADFTGMPPMLAQVGTAEVLYDEVVELASRARAAGVDVTLSTYEDMVHDWQTFTSVGVPEARRAIDEIGAYLRA
ncbi:MAG: alpha/beta hydrolase [Myxococcales bacterium]|nr:alpha/beta hydrolase [Myxococcales bacterium]